MIKVGTGPLRHRPDPTLGDHILPGLVRVAEALLHLELVQEGLNSGGTVLRGVITPTFHRHHAVSTDAEEDMSQDGGEHVLGSMELQEPQTSCVISEEGEVDSSAQGTNAKRARSVPVQDSTRDDTQLLQFVGRQSRHLAAQAREAAR